MQCVMSTEGVSVNLIVTLCSFMLFAFQFTTSDQCSEASGGWTHTHFTSSISPYICDLNISSSYAENIYLYITCIYAHYVLGEPV